MQEKLAQLGDQNICPIAVFIRNKKFLTGMRNYRLKHFQADLWTCPGGRCDENETIEQTLRREAAEEVNITDFQILKLLGEVPGAKNTDIVPVFLCETTEEATLMEPEKFKEWKWATPEDVQSNFINRDVLELIRKTLDPAAAG